MSELEIIQKLDNIIADLLADGLHDIAMSIEIEKQKVAKQFRYYVRWWKSWTKCT